MKNIWDILFLGVSFLLVLVLFFFWDSAIDYLSAVWPVFKELN